MRIDDVTGRIVDSALRLHSALGPGLLESAYEACLAHELRTHGLRLDVGYGSDMLVEEAVVVENKAVTKLAPIFEAQLPSYLRLGGYRVGLLINFHELRLKVGIRRMVNQL